MNLYLHAPIFDTNILCPHCSFLHPYKHDKGECEGGYYKVVKAQFSKKEYIEYWRNLFFVIYQEKEGQFIPIYLSKTYPWIGNILKKHMNYIKITKINLLNNKILYNLPLNKFKLFNNLITIDILKKYLKCGRVVVEPLSVHD